MTSRIFWPVLLVAALHVPCGQQTGESPLSITISTPTETVKAGTDVYIRVQMKNNSDHDLDCSSYYVGGSNRRFRVEVRGEDGSLMKRNDLHPELMPGSLQPCTLAPGQSTAEAEDRVSWSNDFSRPGTYTIQVSRVVGQDEKSGIATSNKITIRVIP